MHLDSFLCCCRSRMRQPFEETNGGCYSAVRSAIVHSGKALDGYASSPRRSDAETLKMYRPLQISPSSVCGRGLQTRGSEPRKPVSD
jgi:hypothetical protein